MRLRRSKSLRRSCLGLRASMRDWPRSSDSSSQKMSDGTWLLSVTNIQIRTRQRKKSEVYFAQYPHIHCVCSNEDFVLRTGRISMCATQCARALTCTGCECTCVDLGQSTRIHSMADVRCRRRTDATRGAMGAVGLSVSRLRSRRVCMLCARMRALPKPLMGVPYY
jgi:hypothetical protein